LDKFLEEHFKSEEWLKDLFDNAHDMIQVVHLDGTLVYVNRSWTSWLGYTPEEIIGNSIYSLIDENDVDHYKEIRHRVMNGEKVGEFIFKLTTKDGNKLSIEGLISGKFKDGICLYTRGIFRNISARLRNEAQLQRLYNEVKEKENNLQQLLTNAPDAVIVTDQDSIIRFWNPKACELFGWSAEEVLLRRLAETIIPPQYREAHYQGMKRFLESGEARILNKTVEITALNKSNQEFYVSLTISRTYQDGNLAFIAFIRDITVEKTNQLALIRKTKELERSNVNLQEFAYAASHDLKEPVRKIHIFSNLLRNNLGEKLDDEEANWFLRMDKAAQRMSTLIDDLLDYSVVGQGADFFEETDLNQIVREVMEDLELERQEKKAEIIMDELPIIKGQKRQLNQLFHNLLANALKYHKLNTWPVINLRYQKVIGRDMPVNLTVEDQHQSFHFLEISDNGIGFDEQDADRIFNVFTRLHGNAEYSGTGVGLSIARKVVQNHFGYIWAESSKDNGATFKILLPAIS
jgi:PAS domain S-box-containing protein